MTLHANVRLALLQSMHHGNPGMLYGSSSNTNALLHQIDRHMTPMRSICIQQTLHQSILLFALLRPWNHRYTDLTLLKCKISTHYFNLGELLQTSPNAGRLTWVATPAIFIRMSAAAVECTSKHRSWLFTSYVMFIKSSYMWDDRSISVGSRQSLLKSELILQPRLWLPNLYEMSITTGTSFYV